ncbi:MAG TPA: cupredoxin family copper-binding protein [Tepidisphaeraceae bacterium]|nr:cupredoxin family copper-binding protein [Tepidisphaeraceae bacterium]
MMCSVRRPLYAPVILLLMLAVAVAAKAKDDAKPKDDAKAKDEAKIVNIGKLKYDPAEVTIKAGEKVVWVNKDDNDHTVTANDGSFKSENLGRGEKFEHTFKKPGRYEYHCRYHPRMKAVIIVK